MHLNYIHLESLDIRRAISYGQLAGNLNTVGIFELPESVGFLTSWSGFKELYIMELMFSQLQNTYVSFLLIFTFIYSMDVYAQIRRKFLEQYIVTESSLSDIEVVRCNPHQHILFSSNTHFSDLESLHFWIHFHSKIYVRSVCFFHTR